MVFWFQFYTEYYNYNIIRYLEPGSRHHPRVVFRRVEKGRAAFEKLGHQR